MSQFMNSQRRAKPEDLRVDMTSRPDWVSGTERTLKVGDQVLCTGGMAEVVQMLGKTGDGSRLLALRLLDGNHPPFFVAGSNVLVPPPGHVNGMMIG
ncbi:MAG: hypothetical protein KFH98_02490 [Gemmatimonadetes bacterium]|nr:hypothetical protein [Gemmatimonadota bacterium]